MKDVLSVFLRFMYSISLEDNIIKIYKIKIQQLIFVLRKVSIIHYEDRVKHKSPFSWYLTQSYCNN